MNNSFLAGALSTLVLVVVFLLFVNASILYLQFMKDDLQPKCNSMTGIGVLLYDGDYVRDLTTKEKRKACPVWTPTPTDTYVPYPTVYGGQFPPSSFSSSTPTPERHSGY